MTRQSKKESLLESVANIVIGMGIGLTAQLIIFPLVGLDVSLNQNIKILIAFTLVSLARTYFIRRFFEGRRVS